MISPDRERNVGYKAKYETATGSLTYEWKHHALGLDGNWTSWESIERFIDETDQPEWWGEEPGGAFIHRDSILETSEAAEFPEPIFT
jgi:hypothetical protein